MVRYGSSHELYRSRETSGTRISIYVDIEFHNKIRLKCKDALNSKNLDTYKNLTYYLSIIKDYELNAK